jgi:hypothetical protein
VKSVLKASAVSVLQGAADMRAFLVAATLAVTLANALPVQACVVAGQLNPDDIQRADVVVTGVISNYELILDQRAREQRRQWLRNSPNMPPRMRETLQNQTSFLSDYASFRITVRETLVGEAPRVLTVTWNNSTFGEPEVLTGEYLIALSGDSNGQYAVLQSPCDPAFIFESSSDLARDIRRRIAE